MKTILTTIIAAILSIGTHAGPDGKLTFFGGVTDPNVNAFPDTAFTGLGIWNAVNCTYSDLQPFVQTGLNSFNWSNFDAMSNFVHANGLHRIWYGGYIGSNGLSDNLWSALGLTGQGIVEAENNFLAAASARDPTIEYINICNEAITNSSGAFQQAFGGAGSTGYDWLINVAKLIRQYFPNAKLGFNDLDFESAGNDMQYGWGYSRLSQMLSIIQILKNAGAIDWVGEEGYSLESCSSENLTSSMNQIGALGVGIIMTEFSPDAYAGPNVDPNKVLSDWQRLFPLYYSNQYVWGIIGPWGYKWSNTQNGGVGGSQFILDDRANPMMEQPVVNYLRSIVSSVVTGGSPPPPGGAFVQEAHATPQNAAASVTVPFAKAQTAGSANVVVVGWNDATNQVSGVTDANGNSYVLAVPAIQYVGGNLSQAIYFSSNIQGGANSVTVAFSGPVPFADVRIAEYSGIHNFGVSSSAFGSSAKPSSGSVNPSQPVLLVSAVTTAGEVSGSDAGFNNRAITFPDGDLLQDGVVTGQTGPFVDGATLGSDSYWVSQLVSFN
jgi:endo-1,4-beta-xylanase